MSIMTEWVKMKVVEGVTTEAFIQIVDSLEQNFHKHQPGFIDSELFYNEVEQEWIMIQHWSSESELKAASRSMFDEPLTEKFRNALDPKQVKLMSFAQLGVWVK